MCEALWLHKGAGRAGHAAGQLLAVHIQHHHTELPLSLPDEKKVSALLEIIIKQYIPSVRYKKNQDGGFFLMKKEHLSTQA